MPTTTKMGIAYPASTDLVKDGATNMGTIATTVDAKTGLVLINTTSFTGVASQSINDVFSSNFTNYIINTNMKTDVFRTVNMRLRVAGADNSTANYAYQTLFASGASVSGTRTTGQTSFVYTYIDEVGLVGIITQIFNPFASERTVIMTKSNSFSQNAIEDANFTGVFNATTSFTGFSLLPSAGTMTGSVSVYGYNK
jgi:hypothetical protein